MKASGFSVFGALVRGFHVSYHTIIGIHSHKGIGSLSLRGLLAIIGIYGK